MKHLITLMFSNNLVPSVSLPGARHVTRPDQGLSQLQRKEERPWKQGYLENFTNMYLQAV